MIKATELRIGNWVNFYNDGVYFQVTEIAPAGLGVKNKDEETWIELDQFDPIPLTPELLGKCGFVQTLDMFGFEIRNGKTLFIEIGSKTWINNPYGDCFLPYSFQYLHELQNAFPFLTGTELAVNL